MKKDVKVNQTMKPRTLDLFPIWKTIIIIFNPHQRRIFFIEFLERDGRRKGVEERKRKREREISL